MSKIITLFKDTNNNFWHYESYDEQSKLHQVTIVDCDDGHYINTNISWYMTDEELNHCTKVEVNVE